MKKFISSMTLIMLIFISVYPSIASADTLPGDASQVGYVLNADVGNHLTDAGWCAAQGKQQSWPTALATCNTGGGTVPDFNKSTSSYVMFRDLEQNPPLTDGNGHTLKTNRFTLYIASPNHKMTFYKGPDANNTQQYYVTSDALIYKAILVAEPNSDPDYKYNWTGSYAANQYYSASSITFDPNAITGFRGFVIGNDQQAGQVGAVNTAYSSSWDLAQFTNHIPFGTDGATSCGTLDVGCWIGKLTTGFTNVVKGIFGLLVDACSWLFIPDSGIITSNYNTLSSTLGSHLGFLSYPFTFIGGLWNSFTQTDSWCNNTSCVKHVGAVFGSDWSIDFGAVQRITPTIWTFIVLAIRGLAVVTIIFALRAKMMEVLEE